VCTTAIPKCEEELHERSKEKKGEKETNGAPIHVQKK
jgi:hypothetical protein